MIDPRQIDYVLSSMMPARRSYDLGFRKPIFLVLIFVLGGCRIGFDPLAPNLAPDASTRSPDDASLLDGAFFSAQDTGTADVGQLNANLDASSDAGLNDTGLREHRDAAGLDARIVDADVVENRDAGPLDTGVVPPDAGRRDAGLPDAGSVVRNCNDPVCAPCMWSCNSGGCVCQDGCPCDFSCNGASTCTPTCTGANTRCILTANTVDTVMAVCSEASSCALDCNSVDTCRNQCESGADCDVYCNSVDRCEIQCAPQSSCRIRCNSTDVCQIVGCSVPVVTCSDGSRVCNRPCP